MKAVYVPLIPNVSSFEESLDSVRSKYPFIVGEVVFAYDQKDTIAWLRIDSVTDVSILFTVINSFFDGEL
jgi:hypothetical protein